MKKILFSLVSCIIPGFGIAQYSNFSPDSRFSDNISIGIEGGIQSNLSDFKISHGAVFGLNLNKDLTPYFGLSIEALAGLYDNANWSAYNDLFKDGHGIDNLSGFLTGRWNILNSLGGFKGYRRFFEIETNIGVGYGKFFTKNKQTPDWQAIQAKAGLNLNFFLTESRDFSINLRPTAIWNISNTGQFDSPFAVAQITVGLTYHFQTSNGTHYFIKNRDNQLVTEIENLKKDNIELLSQLENKAQENQEPTVVVEKVVEEVIVPKYIDNTFIINFAVNSASLVGNAKSILDKIPSNVTVNITGYSSPEGNRQYNLKLSERRANAVKEYLQSRGVKVNKAVGDGAINEESNRLVIVTILNND